MLEIRNLHASVEGKEILRGINLTIRDGEVHVKSSSMARIFSNLNPRSVATKVSSCRSKHPSKFLVFR